MTLALAHAGGASKEDPASKPPLCRAALHSYLLRKIPLTYFHGLTHPFAHVARQGRINKVALSKISTPSLMCFQYLAHSLTHSSQNGKTPVFNLLRTLGQKNTRGGGYPLHEKLYMSPGERAMTPKNLCIVVFAALQAKRPT